MTEEFSGANLSLAALVKLRCFVFDGRIGVANIGSKIGKNLESIRVLSTVSIQGVNEILVNTGTIHDFNHA